jgi:hypothetical protein
MKSLSLDKSRLLLHSKYEYINQIYTHTISFLSIVAILSANPDIWRASEIHSLSIYRVLNPNLNNK